PKPQLWHLDAFGRSRAQHQKRTMSSFAGREELFSNIHRAFSEAGIQVTTEVQDVRVERKRSASRL
ncbi:MAG: hypothetical protein V2I65_20925, partial [Paracoccaceae bacterium]|nr:hypothetical protein [Paracoccaceae bacterium]